MHKLESSSTGAGLHEALYRAVLRNPFYGICRTTEEGKFQEVNDTLVGIMGYASQEELLASSFHPGAIFNNAGDRTRLFEAEPVDGEPTYIELEWLRKDGTPVKVRVSGRGIEDAQGEKLGYQLVIENIDQQRALEEQLRRVAHTDALTGLPNYRSLQDALDAEIRRSERTGRQFSVLLMDCDAMKEINDLFGHLQGNRALCRIAAVLRKSCRAVDTPARFGGDEFAVVLPETGSADAWQLAVRLFNALDADHEEPRLSVSLGMRDVSRGR